MKPKNETPPPNTGGARAVRGGKKLETRAAEVLEQVGYVKTKELKREFIGWKTSDGEKMFEREVFCGDTIYSLPRRVDLGVINDATSFQRVVIECRWQTVGGSVDEKLPYLFLNAKKTFEDHGIPTIALVDGNGAKPNSVEWLRSQVSDSSGLFAVWTFDEFQQQVVDGFFG